MHRSTSSTSEAAGGGGAPSEVPFFLLSESGLFGVWATAQPTTPTPIADEASSRIRNMGTPFRVSSSTFRVEEGSGFRTRNVELETRNSTLPRPALRPLERFVRGR